MKVGVIGAGYVGLTTAVALGYIGHEVTVLDINPDRIASLKKGVSPIHEEGMEDMLSGISEQNLSFSVNYTDLTDSELIIIAVGTPAMPDGKANMAYLEGAAVSIAEILKPGQPYIIVVKSTVPIGSNQRVEHIIRRHLGQKYNQYQIDYASNPEFLREGFALFDTFFPERIVIGCNDEHTKVAMNELYAPIVQRSFKVPEFIKNIPDYTSKVFLTDRTSAELIKYSANAFLSVKISFINEIARLAEYTGADIISVSQGIGSDSRIGTKFLEAGIGWGGSCFPKDTSALISIAREYDLNMPLIEAAININSQMRKLAVSKLQSHFKVLRGLKVGILGLSFKPGTDDVRDAPAIDIINILLNYGSLVYAHDPIVKGVGKHIIDSNDIEYMAEVEDLLPLVDALVITTDWPMYKQLNWQGFAEKYPDLKLVVDGRNMLVKNGIRFETPEYAGIGIIDGQ